MSVNPNQWFAGLVVLVCGALLLRMLMGVRRRARFDAIVLAGWQRWAQAWRNRLAMWRRWRARRDGEARAAQAAQAERLAEEAIQRARRTRADKDGNVIRPEAFKEPRKPH